MNYPGEHRHLISSLCVLILTLVVLMLCMTRDLNIYDESIVLVGAMRWTAGEMLHRDFYANYGPANYAVVSGLVSVFGESMMTIRLYAVFTMASVITLTYRLLVSRTTLPFCLLGTGLCGSFILGSPFYLYSVFPVMALALLGTHFLLPVGSQITAKRALLSGMFTGVAALFRYDSGFFILLAHSLVILLVIEAGTVGARIRRTLPLVITYATGSLFAFLPFAILYLTAAPLGPFMHDIFEYPLEYYRRMRGLPFPDVSALIKNPLNLGVYFPVLAVGLALSNFWLSRQSGQMKCERSTNRLFVAMFVFTVVLFYKGLVRVETVHMLMSIIPATLLVALTLQGLWLRQKAAWVLALMPVIWVAPSAVVAWQVLQNVRDPYRTLGGETMLSAIGRDQCADQLGLGPLRLAPKYAAVGQFLRQHTSKSDRVFVGLNRHDKTFANPIGVYVAAGRLPATHWHQFDPGLQNRADIQKEIIADLIRYKAKWIVRDSSFSETDEPNESSKSSGVLNLDRFIAEQYRPVAQADNVVVWHSKISDYPVFQNTSKCSGLVLLGS